MSDRSVDGRTVLLVSNRRLDENAGRAEKFASRAAFLEDHGWNLEVGYVEPTVTGTPVGTVRCVGKARAADVVNSVSNPPQLHLAGAVAAKATGTPWLAEFRDPLVVNPDVERGSLAARARRAVERFVLTSADKVVWYDGIQIPDDYFAREYPDVPSKRYRQLPPIGFERAEFESVEPTTFDPFTVAYAGSFYEGWIEPYTFIDGLGSYVRATGDDDVQALFYGDWAPEYDRAAKGNGVAEHVDPREFVPHEEIVGVLEGADALLYVGGSDPGNRLNLPSKLYDYIGARRPMLAIVDPSFRVAEVIREYQLGIVVDPGDADGVREALKTLRSGEFDYAPDGEAYEQFTRERSAGAYLDVLASLVDA